MTGKSLAALLLALLPVAAQAEMAIIQGKLKDATGAPVVGYPVILENQTSAAQGWSSNIGFTSATGEFSVAVDQPGTYTAMVPTAPNGIAEFKVPAEQFGGASDKTGATQDIGTIMLPASNAP